MIEGTDPAGIVTGFVLVGGQSLRMGQNKALLRFQGLTLAENAASALSKVANAVCFVGAPELYSHLGHRVIPDFQPGRGPLSGIEAALSSPQAAEWNLILACDMPQLPAGVFTHLAFQALQASSQIDCIVPQTADRLQPLCAMYRRRCGQLATLALQQGTRRVVDWVATLHAQNWAADPVAFRNVNTRSEWDLFLATQSA